jgi:hypothetical protein
MSLHSTLCLCLCVRVRVCACVFVYIYIHSVGGNARRSEIRHTPFAFFVLEFIFTNGLFEMQLESNSTCGLGPGPQAPPSLQ